MNILVRLMAVLALAFLGIAGGAFGMLLADRRVPITVSAVSLVPPPPTVGGTLRVQYDQTYSQECAVKVERMIFDSANVRWVLPDMDFATTKAGRSVHISPVPVPEGAAVGPARYRVLLSFRCNPFHSLYPVVARLDDFAFDIEPAK